MLLRCLLYILCSAVLEKKVLAAHDEVFLLQTKFEMKAPQSEKYGITLAEESHNVELQGANVGSFSASQVVGRKSASNTGTVAFERNAQNVLFIVADDLRSAISGLNPEASHMHTPYLNAFIKESLVLTNSHVQQALCAPSRASVLYGRRPDTMQVWLPLNVSHRNHCKTCKTIPEVFKDAGYYTIGMGKIFDDGGFFNNKSDPFLQDAQSWSDPSFAGKNWFYGTDTGSVTRVSWEIIDESVNGPLQDSQVRDYTLTRLRELTARNSSQPWFLAVGFRKPHLPFVCPKEFYNLYNMKDIKLASNPFAPQDMPAVAFSNEEVVKYHDIEELGYTGAINEALDHGTAKELVRGYQACVSYLDYNVGTLLHELKMLGQWNSTIVVLWSDHGYKLGEHSGWGKATNFFLDTSAPIMLRVPGLTDGGVVSGALVEHVDIMATLLDAAGFHPPEICSENHSWMMSYCTEGRSFLNLASNPTAIWKNSSFSQFESGSLQYMGYSMTTNKKLRFTAWVDFDRYALTTNFSMNGKGCGFELYNHSTDPQENFNLAYRGVYETLVQELFMQLKLGWRATNTLL